MKALKLISYLNWLGIEDFVPVVDGDQQVVIGSSDDRGWLNLAGARHLTLGQRIAKGRK